MNTTYGHYRAVLTAREAALAAVEADLAAWCTKAPYAEPVRRLGAYRGVTHLGALSLEAEVCDWRRFGRASAAMGCVGLVPSEHSSGGSVHRGHLTKAGNTHLRAQLVEGAWAYQHRPPSVVTSAPARRACPPRWWPRAWAAQLRLCGWFRQLAAPKNSKSVVAAAVARELTGSCGPR